MKLTFDLLDKTDIHLLAETFNFPWTTQQATIEKWTHYYDEQMQQKRKAYLVKMDSQILGYGSLLLDPAYSYFKTHNIPEISDVWVATEYRQKGVATQLIAYIESISKSLGYKKIGLGVGLYKDYGSAQKLYCKLGYIPDGNGITYNNCPVIPGKSYCVDDNLVLWMTKSLH